MSSNAARAALAPRARLSLVAGTALAFVSGLGAQGRAPLRPTLGTLAISFMAPVRSAMTLAAWRVAYPADSVLRSWEGNGQVQCAAVHRHVPVDGGDTSEVRVLFYVPPVPATRRLPVNQTPDQVLGLCQAGAVEVTVRARSVMHATAIRHALDADLAAAHLFGDSVSSWPQSRAGNTNGNYRYDDSVVVAAKLYVTATQSAITSPCCEVMVEIAARRAHEFEGIAEWNRTDTVATDAPAPLKARRTTDQLTTMLRGAAVGGALERDMGTTLDRLANDTTAVLGVPADTVIDLLHRWLTITARLPATRRAAALVVADSLMMSWNDYFGADSAGDMLHDHLTAIGVPVALHHSDEDGWYYGYQRDWPMQAYRIAPTSPAGEYAFLHVVAPSDKCAADPSALLARSEGYLRRYPHASIRGQLHALLGEYWMGLVAIRSAAGGDVHQRADSARRRAIMHFQRAFELNVDPWLTWNDAFMLLAGLPTFHDAGDCE